jgi:hypothetical protein
MGCILRGLDARIEYFENDATRAARLSMTPPPQHGAGVTVRRVQLGAPRARACRSI